MKWKKPHINKIYEALTAIADKRITIEPDKKTAKVFSSSGNKFYTVIYDKKKSAIMADDNSAYYTNTLSYPMIAMLMLLGEVQYNEDLLPFLKNIKWKDINQKCDNDYDKSTEFVLNDLASRGVDINFVKSEIKKVYEVVCSLKLFPLGEKKEPSKAY